MMKMYFPEKGLQVDNVEFSIGIDDIREVRMMGGLG
jgi:hypothetical protein